MQAVVLTDLQSRKQVPNNADPIDLHILLYHKIVRL